MNTPNPASRHAAVLLSLLVLAACGGDDSPTAPGGGRLDSRLFGTWVSESMGFGYTFEENGSGTVDLGGEAIDLVWWTEEDTLMLAIASVFRYSISNGALTFTEAGEGEAHVSFSEYVFRADGNPDGLTGATWVDEDGDELVFRSDGTYRWSNVTSGSWIAEGRTISVYDEDDAAGADYQVSGNTLTFDGERFSKR